MAIRVTKEIRAIPVIQALRVPKGTKEILEPPDRRDLRETKGTREIKVTQAQLVRKGRKVTKEIPVRKVLKETKAIPEALDLRVHRGRKEIREQQEHRHTSGDSIHQVRLFIETKEVHVPSQSHSMLMYRDTL